jgi:elongation factor Ts
LDVSIELVKELRNKTGAGMMDCKNALVQSEGNFELAIEFLRKKGAASSQKRSEKIAKEGLIIARTNDSKNEAVIAEVNCETDFVAKSEAFKKFANNIVVAALNHKVNNVEQILDKSIDSSLKVSDSLNDLLASVGEKIEIKRVNYLKSDNGFFCEYNHMGNKVGSLIELNGSFTDRGAFLGNELAMQVVAMKPIAIDRSEIDKTTLDKEKEIYITQAKNEKKPDNIAEKIAINKIEKYFQENCLLEQEYIKEPSKTVTDIIKEISKEVGIDYTVSKMLRFQLGETIQ